MKNCCTTREVIVQRDKVHIDVIIQGHIGYPKRQASHFVDPGLP
jgi:hypothetical protein